MWWPLEMGGSNGSFIGRLVAMLLITVLAGAMAVPSTLGTQPEDCRLYQVTPEQPSPTLEVGGTFQSDTYISFDLLFANSTATINIFYGDTSMMFDNGTTKTHSPDSGNFSTSLLSSCQMTVNKANLSLHGSCFQEKEIPLKCSETGGVNTIHLMRKGSILLARIDGKESDNKVLTLQASSRASDTDKGILVQVSSDTIVNTAFNCQSKCFQFYNAIIHSKEMLVLSAQQNTFGDTGNATGVIQVIHGEDWNEKNTFNFTFHQQGTQEDDEDLSEKFVVISQYTNQADSMNILEVSGSLINIDTPEIIGLVPSTDTYFKFENMDTILWTMCEDDQAYEISSTDVMTDIPKIMATRSTESILDIVTEEITTADQNTEDIEIETDVEVASKVTEDTSITPTISTATERFIEEMNCKDTRDPKCTLTNDQGGSCSCSEAKQNGWCDELEKYPDIKENCKRTCGLCPDQGGAINGGPNVPDITNDIEGRNNFGVSKDSVAATKPPNAGTPSGNIFVYVMIGIVVVMLLVLVIWLTCKKRRASGQMDLEGQSHNMSLKESTEKTNGNNSGTEKINTQENEDNKERAKNDALQEQEEVKKTKNLQNEKSNTEDGNTDAAKNSTIKDTSEGKNPDDKSPIDNAIDHKKEKDMEYKVDDKEYTNDNISHGDNLPNGDNENNPETENENENASKGIADSLENKKSTE